MSYLWLSHVIHAAGTQVVLLLDGRPLGRYTFAGGVLRTAEPVAWALPDGRGSARVQLTLAFGAALGYGRYKGAPTISYVGPQANGVLWADPADAPLGWPICPPQVAGKVRCATSLDSALLFSVLALPNTHKHALSAAFLSSFLSLPRMRTKAQGQVCSPHGGLTLLTLL